ncbi:MAG TPA: substrate-binding domain-containing protein [Phycisphaerae bacterium]|nr:substrate-binding domain-containing protein [Phycisphaerae bacterium]
MRIHPRLFYSHTLIRLFAAGTFVATSLACDKSSAPKDARIGAILMQQDQFFRSNEQGMTDRAAELGVSLSAQNAAGALDKEISLIDAFIARKVSAILVSPLSSKGSINALRRAHDAGIKIITYNNSIDADFPACRIESDQTELGASTGRTARAYVEKNLGGKARVVLIGFSTQLPEQGGARQRGFRDEITKLPGVEIIAEQDAWLAPKAAEIVSELLTKNPDVIWAANEGGTVGSAMAVRNAGKAGTIAVFGTDVSRQLIEFLLADDGILVAVTGQKPREMGATAVDSAVKAVRGEAVEKSKTLPGELFHRAEPKKLRAYLKTLE